MAKKKYYAVRKGLSKGIFLTWEECKKQVNGYPGAEYKSFGTIEEAEAFLGTEKTGVVGALAEKKAAVRTGSSETQAFAGDRDESAVRIYVDGSFHSGTGEFSYGMVVLRDGEELSFSKKFRDRELAQMHNVAGEIKGAEAAMQYALDEKLPSIVIYHDYEGIAKWCNGAWKANKSGTIAYRDFYRRASEKVQIEFVKVKGHSNDKYNDMVDKLAKEALGIL